jgi:hypothetical protein
MDRVKLACRIEEADIPKSVSDFLLKRLSVASHEGVAAVVRDFEVAMVQRRAEVLQSHKRFWRGITPPPRDKRMPTLLVK